jgi:hypothetical protein
MTLMSDNNDMRVLSSSLVRELSDYSISHEAFTPTVPDMIDMPRVDNRMLKLQAEAVKYAPLHAYSQGLSSASVNDEEFRLMEALLNDSNVRTTTQSKLKAGGQAFMVIYISIDQYVVILFCLLLRSDLRDMLKCSQ